MKVVFIGCVESSEHTLRALLGCEGIEISGIVTCRVSNFNSDFVSLENIAREHGIPVFLTDGQSTENMAAWLIQREPEICFCIGWSYLLPRLILDIPLMGVVGYHPTLLPRNRGRHPIIWALALGLEETGSTFFMMDEGADAGAVIDQARVPIYNSDDARSLYTRLLGVAEEQVRAIATHLVQGTLQPTPQDHSLATSWRKRSMLDGQIDWRMSATSIRNLVRALASPYDGAHCLLNEHIVKIHKVEIASSLIDHEPGRILSINDNVITVKSGIDAVQIIDHEFEPLPVNVEYLT